MESGLIHPCLFLGTRTSSLAYWRVHCWLRSELSLRLDFPGSVVRSALGSALRRVACVTGAATCGGCSHTGVCSYGYSFETPLPPGVDARVAGPFAPHPFVLAVPGDRDRIDRGEAFCLALTLVGRGRTHLASFVEAVREMAHEGIGSGRGRLQLTRVDDASPGGNTILDPDRGLFTGEPSDMTAAGLAVVPATRARLIALSPLRLVEKGGPSADVDFVPILRALFRRIGALARFHCGFEPEVDYRGLLERAAAIRVTARDLTWTDLRRYSARQGRRMAMGGVVGSLTFEGELAPFLPFLKLGEDLHVGKGTAFGLGRYRLLTEEETSRDDPGHPPHQP